MSLLTFDNPVFRYYAVAAALMIVKMMSQGWITVFRMTKVNGGFRYPEDAQQSPIHIPAQGSCSPKNMSNARGACMETMSRTFRSSSPPACYMSARRPAGLSPWECSRLTRSRVSPIFMSCLRPDHTTFVLRFGRLAR